MNHIDTFLRYWSSAEDAGDPKAERKLLFKTLVNELTITTEEFKAKGIGRKMASGKGGDILECSIDDTFIFKKYKTKVDKSVTKQMGGKNPFLTQWNVSDTITCLAEGYVPYLGEIVLNDEKKLKVLPKKTSGSNPFAKLGMVIQSVRTLKKNCKSTKMSKINKARKQMSAFRHDREKDVKLSYDFDIYCLLHDTLKITKQFDADIMRNKSIKSCMEKLSGPNKMALRRKVLETDTFPQYLDRDEMRNGFVEVSRPSSRLYGGSRGDGFPIQLSRDLNEVLIQRILARYATNHDSLRQNDIISFKDVFIYKKRLYIKQKKVGIDFDGDYLTNANHLLRKICLDPNAASRNENLFKFAIELGKFVEKLHALRSEIHFRHFDCKLANVFIYDMGLHNGYPDYKFIVSDLDLSSVFVPGVYLRDHFVQGLVTQSTTVETLSTSDSASANNSNANSSRSRSSETRSLSSTGGGLKKTKKKIKK